MTNDTPEATNDIQGEPYVSVSVNIDQNYINQDNMNQEAYVPPPPTPEQVSYAELLQFDTKHRQMAIDKFFDKILEYNRNTYVFPYQKLRPEFVPENFEITDYNSIYKDEGVDGYKQYVYSSTLAFSDPHIPYQPPIMREMFQVGLWKFDTF